MIDRTKSKSKLGIVLLAAIAVVMVIVNPAVAQDSDEATVEINVSTKTMIDINPNSYAWTGVVPGTKGGHRPDTRAQIENIGSTNITKIWFNSTQPADRPFATGISSEYDSGNFIVLAREDSTAYRFIDRKEFNATRELVYLTDMIGNTPPDPGYVYGRFRNTSQEYFWMIDTNSGTDCPSLTMQVGNIPHTKTQTGTIDFSGGGDTQSISLNTADASHCYGDVNLGNTGAQYMVSIDNSTLTTSQAEVSLVKWNMDVPGAGSSTNTEYFWSDTGTPGMEMLPGNSTVAELNAYVPYGVAQGNSSIGTVTVIANTA